MSASLVKIVITLIIISKHCSAVIFTDHSVGYSRSCRHLSKWPSDVDVYFKKIHSDSEICDVYTYNDLMSDPYYLIIFRKAGQSLVSIGLTRWCILQKDDGQIKEFCKGGCVYVAPLQFIPKLSCEKCGHKLQIDNLVVPPDGRTAPGSFQYSFDKAESESAERANDYEIKCIELRKQVEKQKREIHALQQNLTHATMEMSNSMFDANLIAQKSLIAADEQNAFSDVKNQMMKSEIAFLKGKLNGTRQNAEQNRINKSASPNLLFFAMSGCTGLLLIIIIIALLIWMYCNKSRLTKKSSVESRMADGIKLQTDETKGDAKINVGSFKTWKSIRMTQKGVKGPAQNYNDNPISSTGSEEGLFDTSGVATDGNETTI